MKKSRFLKITSLVVTVVFVLFAFASCSGKKEAGNSSDAGNNIDLSQRPPVDSPANPHISDNHVTPDLPNTQVREATKSEYTATTEEDFVKALENFANPNGNKYDALAVLGDFDYAEKGDELLSRFEEASKEWHAQIVEQVGDKCIVTMTLKENTPVELSDTKVADWETVSGIKCEAYSNIKCTIATNYAKDSITLSFDIVKIDGNWHFANVSSINNVLNAITTSIY